MSNYSDLMLSQAFQPMAAQLSQKSALSLATILATESCRISKTGPSNEESVSMSSHRHDVPVSPRDPGVPGDPACPLSPGSPR